MGAPEYVSLHTHTHNSLLDGFSTTQEYVQRAVELKLPGLGASDHGNTFGTYDFIKSCRDAGLTPVPGCEFYVAPLSDRGLFLKEPVFYGNPNQRREDVSSRGAYLHLTVWAYNNTGLSNLFKLSTISNAPERFYQKPRIDFDLLADHAEGLIVSTGCPSSEISTRFRLGQHDKAYEYAGRLKEVFGDKLFMEIMDHNMTIPLERELMPLQMEMARKLNLPLLATNDSHYALKENAKAHEEMLCSQSGALMSDKTYDEGGPRFAFNGDQYYLKSAEEMASLFSERDFPGALSNSLLIAEMASDINMSYNPHLKPKPVIPDGFADDVAFYKHLLNEGFKWRYADKSSEVKAEAVKRIHNEMNVIHSSDFIGYMLTVRDYLKFTRDKFSTRNEAGEIVALSLGVGRGCFLPGTMVRTRFGEKAIEELAEKFPFNKPKTVLTHDGTQQEIEDVFTYDVEDEDVVEVTLSNGKTFSCTADHRIFKKEDGFVQAGDLMVGDLVLGSKGVDNSGLNVTTENSEKYRSELPGVQARSGVFGSERVDKSIYFASSYELKALNIFETDSSVIDFDRCVDVIDYTVDGVSRKYLPDFDVHTKDGRTVIEVKAAWELTSEVFMAKAAAAEEFYGKLGVKYQVWTEKELAERNDWFHNEWEVVSIKRSKYTGKVYDLQVANVHNYTVADTTVHNSVGGSIHAFILGISEIDPIEHDLIFERFLSAGRGATYRITYDDGTSEDIIVSDEKNVVGDNGEALKRYIHQLNVGDSILDESGDDDGTISNVSGNSSEGSGK